MDRNTYTNPDVIKCIHDKFYPGKLNAETRKQLRGKQFKYNDTYRVHDYAILLTGGQLSYPSTILPAEHPSHMSQMFKNTRNGTYPEIFRRRPLRQNAF